MSGFLLAQVKKDLKINLTLFLHVRNLHVKSLDIYQTLSSFAGLNIFSSNIYDMELKSA